MYCLHVFLLFSFDILNETGFMAFCLVFTCIFGCFWNLNGLKIRLFMIVMRGDEWRKNAIEY